MGLESFLPLFPLVLGYASKYFLDYKWRIEVEKALFGSVFFFSVLFGIDFRLFFIYSIAAIVMSAKNNTIYISIFGTILSVFAFISANQLFALIPLALISGADPLAQLLNKTTGRETRGFVWMFAMLSLSLAGTAYLLVALGPLNPLWAILIAAVATWASVLNDKFSILYTLIALGCTYGSLSGLVGGFGFGLILSSFAYYLRALDFNGLIGGALLGMLVFSASPLLFFVMVAFLFSASLIGKLASHDERYQKKGERNAIQVLVNGFGPALASILILLGFNALGVGIVAVAASTADTWATEIGSKSKRKPRMITTMNFVDKGRSGGITPLGLFASVLGGFFIFVFTFPFYGILYLVQAIAGGIVGSLIDSLMGATVQGIYRCRVCSKITENEKHCGKSTLIEQGLWWMNNDMVNLLSTLFAMVIIL